MGERIKICFAFLLAVIMLLSGFMFFNKKDIVIEDISASPTITIESEQKQNTITVNHKGEMVSMDMEEYLISVVAGEVYPTYNSEALKAQAVAARTYLVYKMNGGGCSNGGDICTESTHCQAYKSEETMRSQWGEKYQEYYDNIKNAVYDTLGEVIKYEGKPICALYHSSSVGQTEDCVAVFGGTYPYLKSVPTSISENNSEYQKETTFTKKEFLEKINKSFSLDLEKIDIKIISHTSSGRVSTLKLGDKSVKATALRKALGLRSTDFTFENNGDSITFIMKGYGHGVGLSQVGAQEMAENGKTYKEILTHYYTGTNIEKYK